MPLFGGGRRAAWAMVPARAGKPLSAAVPPGFHVPAEFFVSFGGWRRGASDSLDGLAAARLRERPLLLPQGCGRGACYVENRSPKRLAHPLRFLRSPSLFLNFSPPAFPACFPCLLLRLLSRLLSCLLSPPAFPACFSACFPACFSACFSACFPACFPGLLPRLLSRPAFPACFPRLLPLPSLSAPFIQSSSSAPFASFRPVRGRSRPAVTILFPVAGEARLVRAFAGHTAMFCR